MFLYEDEIMSENARAQLDGLWTFDLYSVSNIL